MNFTKTLVAAALMAGAASANATLVAGNDGSEELYLQVYNPTYVNADNTVGATFNYDTNVSFSQLETIARSGDFSSLNTLLSQGLSADAHFNTFIAQNNSSVRYGLFVGRNDGLNNNVGAFITSVNPAAQIDPNDPTAIPGTLASNAEIRAAQVAIGLGNNASDIIQNVPATPEIGQAITSGFTFADAFGGIAGLQAVANFGQAIDFRYIFATQREFVDPLFGDLTVALTYDATQDQTLLGQFNLTSAGLSFTAAGAPVSSVPLPAAVWMFGAGLMGVLRLNRRKAA